MSDKYEYEVTQLPRHPDEHKKKLKKAKTKFHMRNIKQTGKAGETMKMSEGEFEAARSGRSMQPKKDLSKGVSGNVSYKKASDAPSGDYSMRDTNNSMKGRVSDGKGGYKMKEFKIPKEVYHVEKLKKKGMMRKAIGRLKSAISGGGGGSLKEMSKKKRGY